jgi:Flp pilus assembly protein TadD
MRTGKWKLIAAPRSELYDLENDPRETRNVLAEHPAEADRLRARIRDLETARRETAAPGPMDANTRRQLESLGYISGGTPRRARPGAPAPDPKDRIQVLQILARTEDLLSSNQYARAAALMQDGLRLDPTNPRCHLALAMAYEQMGQYDLAIQVFQHALARKVETDKIYSRLGIDYLHLGQHEKGAAALAEASRLNPADLHTLRNLGMAYLQLDRLDDAERVFRAITAQDAAYAAAHNGLGVAAARRGDAAAARRAFEKAIQADPNELKSVLDLGILYQNTGDRQRAVHYLELFLSKVPPGQFTQQLPAIKAAIEQLRAENP